MGVVLCSLLPLFSSQHSIFSSLDVDWVSDIVYVAEEKGVIYAVKLDHSTDRSQLPDVNIAVIYNGSLIPKSLQVHSQEG